MTGIIDKYKKVDRLCLALTWVAANYFFYLDDVRKKEDER